MIFTAARRIGVCGKGVVYCFQNCIFAMIFTAYDFNIDKPIELCIAFKIVSLQ